MNAILASTNNEHQDELNLFAKSVAATIRQLPARQQAMAKIKIQQILMELESDVDPQPADAGQMVTNLSPAATVAESTEWTHHFWPM